MIEWLIFDLDCTLYPDSCGMEREISLRMISYAAKLLGISDSEAAQLRKMRIAPYGTTVEWLMAEHGLRDVDGFYQAVHPEGEEAILAVDPDLRPYLLSIDLPKAIFTNSPMEHAERVLRRLGLEGIFNGIYDIRFSGFRGKPHAEAFLRVCSSLGTQPARCVLVDDVPKYVRGFLSCGGHGVLIDESGRYPREDMPRIRNLYELKSMLLVR